MAARNKHYCRSEEEALAELSEFLDAISEQGLREFLQASIRRFQQQLDTHDSKCFLRLLPDCLRACVIKDTKSVEVVPRWVNEFHDYAVSCMKVGERRSGLDTFLLDMLLVAYEQDFHGQSEFFEWIGRNYPALTIIDSHQITFVMEDLPNEGIPPYEFFLREQPNGDLAGKTLKAYFDTDEAFVRQLLRDVYDVVDHRGTIFPMNAYGITSHFTESLGFVPTTFEDFSVDTFSKQIEYYGQMENYENRKAAFVGVAKIYEYVIDNLEEEQETFTIATGITKELIQRVGFCVEWADGFRPVIHNPADPVPPFAKWLLIPNEEEKKYVSIKPAGEIVDASYDRSDKLEHLLKSWLWRECDSVWAIRTSSGYLTGLFETFTPQDDGTFLVTNAGLTKWFASMRDKHCGHSMRRLQRWARSIISYGCGIGVLEQESTVPLLLSAKVKNTTWEFDESTAADIEDLRKLASELEAHSSDSFLNELYYCVFVTISLTPLRIGNVLALKTSELEEHPGNIHYVRTSTKTDGQGRRDIQIPASVYRLLKRVIELTDDIREDASEEVAERIFIYLSDMRNRVMMLQEAPFIAYLKETCSRLGISYITPGSIRKRYQTEVVLQGVEKNLNRLAIKPLTGHASIATTEKYYVRDDLRHYLEATYGIEIGAPKIKGEIVEQASNIEVPLSEEDAVEGGAGFCRNPECNVPGTLTCLMCKGFVTSPECISEMEEAVANVQQRLAAAADNAHDREHLIAVKRLYVGYLAVMYSMQGKEVGDGK